MPRVQEYDRAIFTWQDKRDILQSCNGICTHCGKKITDDFTIEHVIPLSKGGDNSPENLVALCESCNFSKSDKIVNPKEYYKYLPKTRLKALQAKFDVYCQEHDWLTETSLFKTDQFEIKADYKSVVRLAIGIMPTVFAVNKLSKQQTLEFMHAYTRKHGILDTTPTVIDKITQPYYAVTHNGEIIVVFTNKFVDFRDDAVEFEKNLPNGGYGIMEAIPHMTTMVIDMFTNPDIKPESQKAAIEKVRYIIHGLKEEIKKTLKRNGRHDLLRTTWSANRVDEIAARALEREAYVRERVKTLPDIISNLIKRPLDQYVNMDTLLFDEAGRKWALSRMRRINIEDCNENPEIAKTLIKTYGEITKSGNNRIMGRSQESKPSNKNKNKKKKKSKK